MSLDRTLVGREYPPTEPYRVSREKIREFAQAIGAADQLDPEVAPPTFLVSLTMPAEQRVILDPTFGFELSQVLHRSQQLIHHRPVRAGDVLTVTVTVTAIDVVDGTEAVTLTSTVGDADGASVCTAVSVLISRGEG